MIFIDNTQCLMVLRYKVENCVVDVEMWIRMNCFLPFVCNS